jgi:hypothetical protein
VSFLSLVQATTHIFKIHELKIDLNKYPYDPPRDDTFLMRFRGMAGGLVQLCYEHRASGLMLRLPWLPVSFTCRGIIDCLIFAGFARLQV